MLRRETEKREPGNEVASLCWVRENTLNLIYRYSQA